MSASDMNFFCNGYQHIKSCKNRFQALVPPKSISKWQHPEQLDSVQEGQNAGVPYRQGHFDQHYCLVNLWTKLNIQFKYLDMKFGKIPDWNR